MVGLLVNILHYIERTRVFPLPISKFLILFLDNSVCVYTHTFSGCVLSRCWEGVQSRYSKIDWDIQLDEKFLGHWKNTPLIRLICWSYQLGDKGTTLENWMNGLDHEGECFFLSLFLILKKTFLGSWQKEEVYLPEPRKPESFCPSKCPGFASWVSFS